MQLPPSDGRALQRTVGDRSSPVALVIRIQHVGIRGRTETGAGTHAHAVVRVLHDRFLSSQELAVHDLVVERHNVIGIGLHFALLTARLASKILRFEKRNLIISSLVSCASCGIFITYVVMKRSTSRLILAATTAKPNRIKTKLRITYPGLVESA